MKVMKNLIISLVVGIVAWAIVDLVQSGSVSVPAGTGDIVSLIIMVAAVFTGITLAAVSATLPRPDENHREQGTVKWFNVKKGYGFITRDEGDDVFVHYRNIKGQGRRSISEGQRVEFNVVSSEKGLQADEVEPV